MWRVQRISWIAAALIAGGCGGGTSEMGGVAPSAYAVPSAEEAVAVDAEGGAGGIADAPSDGPSVLPAASPVAPELVAVVAGSGNRDGAEAAGVAVANRSDAAPLLVYTATIAMQV